MFCPDHSPDSILSKRIHWVMVCKWLRFFYTTESHGIKHDSKKTKWDNFLNKNLYEKLSLMWFDKLQCEDCSLLFILKLCCPGLVFFCLSYPCRSHQIQVDNQPQLFSFQLITISVFYCLLSRSFVTVYLLLFQFGFWIIPIWIIRNHQFCHTPSCLWFSLHKRLYKRTGLSMCNGTHTPSSSERKSIQSSFLYEHPHLESDEASQQWLSESV